jgi:hypothetical protein
MLVNMRTIAPVNIIPKWILGEWPKTTRAVPT